MGLRGGKSGNLLREAKELGNLGSRHGHPAGLSFHLNGAPMNR